MQKGRRPDEGISETSQFHLKQAPCHLKQPSCHFKRAEPAPSAEQPVPRHPKPVPAPARQANPTPYPAPAPYPPCSQAAWPKVDFNQGRGYQGRGGGGVLNKLTTNLINKQFLFTFHYREQEAQPKLKLIEKKRKKIFFSFFLLWV